MKITRIIAALLFVLTLLSVSCGKPSDGGVTVSPDTESATVPETETETGTDGEELFDDGGEFDPDGKFDGFYIKKNPKNGLDGDVVLFRKKSNTYIAFIPGNAVAEECRLYWNGRMYSDGNEVYAGKVKLPAKGVTASYEVVSKSGSRHTVNIQTYQGSPDVLPIFINDTAENIGLEGKTVVDFATLDDPDKNPEKMYYYTCTASIGGNTYYASLKGRGNSSWYEAQRSFNIRFYKECRNEVYSGNKKLNLIEGLSKHEYSLVSFSADGSFLRNYVGYNIAYQMGLGVRCRHADLWVNGEYRGIYLLTEKNDSLTPEGGYALEFDNRVDRDQHQIRLPGLYGAEGSGFITVKKNDNPNETPYRDGRQSYRLIDRYIRNAWKALKADGDEYKKYFDVESWAKYYILQEFLKDGDNYGNTYMYLGQISGKNDTAKLKAGPIWDLDHGVALTSYMSLDYNITGWYVQNRVQENFWLDVIDNHEGFADEVEKQRLIWRDLFKTAQGIAEECRDRIRQSAGMHCERWGDKLGYWSTHFAENTVTDDRYRYRATVKWEDYVYNLIMFLKFRSRFVYSNKFTISN